MDGRDDPVCQRVRSQRAFCWGMPGGEKPMAGSLEGIRVMETASVYAGPMAGRLLADWGADVIHIEHPDLTCPQIVYHSKC